MTTMGLGTVTLLEIDQVPSGKRIAYCLPTGEFVFVADTSAPEFETDQASDLYGGNLFQFLTTNDSEKLKDFLRAQQQQQQTSGMDSSHGSLLAFHPSLQMRMVVRFMGNPSRQLWIHLTTIPLTLRMMRCIDSIRSLSNPLSLFADSSSFVLSEDELGSVLKNPTMFPYSSSSPVEGDDDVALLEYESGCVSPESFMTIVPLELKHLHRGLILEDDTSEETGEDEDGPKASLASYAFEADWSSETDRDDSVHEVLSAQPIASISLSGDAAFGGQFVT